METVIANLMSLIESVQVAKMDSMAFLIVKVQLKVLTER